MSDFLHRTTKQYLPSTSAASLPEPVANYIEHPDLSAVAGQPSQYWTINGDVVSLMPQAERDAVDAQVLSDQRDAMANELDRVEDVMRAFALVVLDEINALRTLHGLPARTIAQLKNGVRGKLDS